MFDLQSSRADPQLLHQPLSRPTRRVAQTYGGDAPDYLERVPSRFGSPPIEGRTSLQPSSSVELPFVSMILAHVEREELQAARRLLSIAMAQGTRSPALETLGRLLERPGVRTIAVATGPAVGRPTTANLEPFRGQWVAFVGAQVVSHARTLRALVDELKRRARADRPVIHLVPG